jgi:hypothetical protein
MRTYHGVSVFLVVLFHTFHGTTFHESPTPESPTPPIEHSMPVAVDLEPEEPLSIPPPSPPHDMADPPPIEDLTKAKTIRTADGLKVTSKIRHTLNG